MGILSRCHQKMVPRLTTKRIEHTLKKTFTMVSNNNSNNGSKADGSASDGVSAHGDKTIPFLRRLRDMLVENEEVISFSPGSQSNGRKELGRIVVHDRVKVEANVLPRYFNHSSFASLRRQLNYFAFVRLGKGRQRESSYTNEDVVVLDDILHLKRRPNTGKSRVAKKSTSTSAPTKVRMLTGLTDDSSFDDNATAHSNTLVSVASSTGMPPILNVSHPANGGYLQQRQNKRRRATGTVTAVSPRSLSPLENSFIGEDEHYHGEDSKQYSISLDLTKPDLAAAMADKDVLECCKDLLQLASGKGWD